MAERTGHDLTVRFGAGADDLRAAPRDAIDALRQAGFTHVELSAVGPLAAKHLTGTGRRHFTKYLSGKGIELTALGVTVPRLRIDEQAEAASAAIEMAADVNADIVTVSLAHLGVHGGELGAETIAALERFVDRADVTGRTLVLEAGPLDAPATRELIRRLGHPSVRAVVDPGRFVARGEDARQALLALADHVGLARARDALPGTLEHAGRETPAGDGAVDFDEYLQLLQDFGYHRPTIIRRGGSDRPLADIVAARDRLERSAARIARP